jgi:hypothetical protein
MAAKASDIFAKIAPNSKKILSRIHPQGHRDGLIHALQLCDSLLLEELSLLPHARFC